MILMGAASGTAFEALPQTQVSTRRELTVVSRKMLTTDVVLLSLADEHGERLPAWMPGAHIDLIGPTGAKRQYSLCGDPDVVDCWQIAVLRQADGRGGSLALHDQLSVGDAVNVDGPRNHFRLVDSPSYLFIAGGIGITPIIPMLTLVERAGRPWRLAYGGRTISSMAFWSRLADYGERVALYPSRESQRMDVDAVINSVPGSTAVFCCGPATLIDEVSDRCLTEPTRTLRVERFAAQSMDGASRRGSAFTAKLARSARDVQVADGQTIVEAMETEGLSPQSSCREGLCGACETRVLDGVPDHRDCVLDSEERARGESMMICVSRALSPVLVLDA